MPPTLPFWSSFVLTVVLLAIALWAGWRHVRRVHLVTAPLALLALVLTIVLTEQLMAQYDFPAAAKAIHLPCAKAGGLLAVPVVLTGLWYWRSPRARPWHRAAVVVWLLSVLLATSTGLWMFAQGTARG